MGNKEKGKYLYIVTAVIILLIAVSSYYYFGWFRVIFQGKSVQLFLDYPLIPIVYSILFFLPAFIITRRFGIYWGLSFLLIGITLYTFLGFYYVQLAFEAERFPAVILLVEIFLFSIIVIVAISLPSRPGQKPQVKRIQPIPKLPKDERKEVVQVEVKNMPKIPQPIEIVVKEQVEKPKPEKKENLIFKHIIEEQNRDNEISKSIKKEISHPNEDEMSKNYSEKKKDPEEKKEEFQRDIPQKKTDKENYEIIDKNDDVENRLFPSDYNLITETNRLDLYKNLRKRIIEEITSAQTVFILSLSEEGKLVLDEIYGTDHELKGQVVASVEDGFEGRAIEDKEMKLIYDLDKLAIPDYQTSRLYFKEREIGLRSLLISPLLSQDEVKAVVTIGNFDDHRAFDQEDVLKLEEILGLAQFSVENINQLEETKKSQVSQEKIIVVAKEISSIVNIEMMLKTLLERVVELVGADNGSIMILDELRKELVIRTSIGLNEDIVVKTRVPLGEGIAGWVAEHQKPLLIDDFQEKETEVEAGRPQCQFD